MSNIKIQSYDGNTYTSLSPQNSASITTYSNAKTGISATNVQDAIDSCFTSVSNRKSLIASAITDMGVSTGQNDSFQTMSNNIKKLNSISNLFDLVSNSQILWEVHATPSGVFATFRCDKAKIPKKIQIFGMCFISNWGNDGWPLYYTDFIVPSSTSTISMTIKRNIAYSTYPMTSGGNAGKLSIRSWTEDIRNIDVSITERDNYTQIYFQDSYGLLDTSKSMTSNFQAQLYY